VHIAVADQPQQRLELASPTPRAAGMLSM